MGCKDEDELQLKNMSTGTKESLTVGKYWEYATSYQSRTRLDRMINVSAMTNCCLLDT